MQIIFAILLIIAADVEIAQSQDILNANVLYPTMESLGNRTNISCRTGKLLPGICVKRERCDYGTAIIDFSLYQPRNFKRICVPGEVCCPREYLLSQVSTTSGPEVDDFDFDEDD